MPKISVSHGATYGDPDPDRAIEEEGEKSSQDGKDSSQSSDKPEQIESKKTRVRR